MILVKKMNYGNNMKNLRTANLYSQEFVANKLNIKRSTYKEYELQNSIIPIKHLIEFCDFFNVSIDFIFGFTSIENYKNNRANMNLELSSSRLRELRKDYHLTQQKLARILNTDISTPSKYERKVYPIATPFLYQLCKKYNISADYLLGKIDSPKYFK